MAEGEIDEILLAIGRKCLVGHAVSTKGYLTKTDAEILAKELLAAWEPLIRSNQDARSRIAFDSAMTDVKVTISAQLHRLADEIIAP